MTEPNNNQHIHLTAAEGWDEALYRTRFSSHPHLEHYGRAAVLFDDFSYLAVDGTTHTSKKGTVTDGSSKPRFFWRYLGGPFVIDLEAAIIHDPKCVQAAHLAERNPKAGRSFRFEADGLYKEILVFLHRCGRKGLGFHQRFMLSRGVRIGAFRAHRRRKRG